MKFSAAIEHENFHAVQFHPEKSGAAGETDPGEFSKSMIEIIPAIDIIDGKCVRLTTAILPIRPFILTTRWTLQGDLKSAGIKRLQWSISTVPESASRRNLRMLEAVASATDLRSISAAVLKTDRRSNAVSKPVRPIANIGSVAVNRSGSIFWRGLNKFGGDRILLGADVRGREARDKRLADRNYGIDIIDFLSGKLEEA